MESFWEKLCDFFFPLLKAFIVLFLVDAGLYLGKVDFEIPFIHSVVTFFLGFFGL
jgi:hypothetical protein